MMIDKTIIDARREFFTQILSALRKENVHSIPGNWNTRKMYRKRGNELSVNTGVSHGMDGEKGGCALSVA